MNTSQFDELIEKLGTLLGRLKADNEDSSSGNVIATSASKLFDITYSMRDVERDLEALNSAIIEDLQRHESMAAMTGRLLAVCDSLTSLFNEVQEARRRVRLDDAHDPDDNRAVDADHRRRLHEIISEIVDTRDDVVAEITSVDQGVVFLMTRLEAMAAGVKFENIENSAFHDCVNRKEIALLRRARELTGNLNVLKASTNWREAKKFIRNEIFSLY